MCGATDCPSCGPAQGYEVVRRWDAVRSRYVYVNPEEDDGDLFDPDGDADRYRDERKDAALMGAA
jgi:hypothetical protein